MVIEAKLIIRRAISNNKTAIYAHREIQRAGYVVAWPDVLKTYTSILKEKTENE